MMASGLSGEGGTYLVKTTAFFLSRTIRHARFEKKCCVRATRASHGAIQGTLHEAPNT